MAGRKIKKNKPIACVICGCVFTPKSTQYTTCSDSCRDRNRKNFKAAWNRKRYAKQVADHRATNTKPWAWLRRSVGDDGYSHKVNVLDVLERQSADGDWPWHDVLAGVGPSLCDECPV